MACSWRWFIHPATAISTNRKGSKTLGISLAYSGKASRSALTNQREIKQFEFPDHTGYGCERELYAARSEDSHRTHQVCYPLLFQVLIKGINSH